MKNYFMDRPQSTTQYAGYQFVSHKLSMLIKQNNWYIVRLDISTKTSQDLSPYLWKGVCLQTNCQMADQFMNAKADMILCTMLYWNRSMLVDTSFRVSMIKFACISERDIYRLCFRNCIVVLFKKIVSKYDQEIPQSQTADKPVASRGRAT